MLSVCYFSHRCTIILNWQTKLMFIYNWLPNGLHWARYILQLASCLPILIGLRSCPETIFWKVVNSTRSRGDNVITKTYEVQIYPILQATRHTHTNSTPHFSSVSLSLSHPSRTQTAKFPAGPTQAAPSLVQLQPAVVSLSPPSLHHWWQSLCVFYKLIGRRELRVR